MNSDKEMISDIKHNLGLETNPRVSKALAEMTAAERQHQQAIAEKDSVIKGLNTRMDDMQEHHNQAKQELRDEFRARLDSMAQAHELVKADLMQRGDQYYEQCKVLEQDNAMLKNNWKGVNDRNKTLEHDNEKLNGQMTALKLDNERLIVIMEDKQSNETTKDGN